MTHPKIFLSVGSTSNDTQEAFVRMIEDRLRSEQLDPRTVGRNTWSSEAPLKAVERLMDQCVGAVIIALERYHFETGTEKRGGRGKRDLLDIKLPTAWNQIEASMAYSKNLPLLVLVEDGLKQDGLLEVGSDWYVQTVELNSSALSKAEFSGILADWKAKTLSRDAKKSQKSLNPGELSVAELFGALKPGEVWKVLGVVAAVVGGAFALGAKLIG